MTWEASGSIGERLRALHVRDDIIRKQEMMGALGEAGLSEDVQGGANIDHNFIIERNKRIMKVRQMIDAFRDVVLALQNEPEERALGEHDPQNMANDQTNGNLNALVQGMGNAGAPQIGGGM